MKIALTDKALSALKPKPSRYEIQDTYCPGLSVRVTPEGRKTFNVKYRYGLQQKRMSLGVYPRMTLVEARNRAMEAMRHVDEGSDPAKRRRQPAFRVEAVVTEFIQRYAKPRNRKWMESERILWRELVAVHGQRDIREIKREHPVGKLLGPSAGLISDVSKAAGAPIGAATGDAVTDSQVEAVKRLVPFQSYIGMRQALDLLTHDE